MEFRRKLRFLPSILFLVSFSLLAQESVFSGIPIVGGAPHHDSDKFSFAILGDKTSGGDGQWEIFDRAVDSINLLKPDFVITVGDQIPGHMEEREKWDAEWNEYLTHARRLTVPLILVPGNHDIANTACYRFWQEDFGPTYYSFVYNNCLFLILNTEEERWDGRGPTWEKMMQFAQEELSAKANVRHTFVFFHKPMWDDPRFQRDWARLSELLGNRKYTVVAGHEHYLMTERRNGNLLVVQSATGGGLATSNIREYGAFHSFGMVTVEGTEVTYAVIEPGKGIWSAEIAPTSFRKALSYDVVKVDAAAPYRKENGLVHVPEVFVLTNPFPEPIELELTIHSSASDKWESHTEDGHESKWNLNRELEPNEQVSMPFFLGVPEAEMYYPPLVSWRVQFRGEWLTNENYPMSQENTIMIYPRSCLTSIPEWNVIGPFPIGKIKSEQLPSHPKEANPRLFERLGPEEGYDPERTYPENKKWFSVQSDANGLLNFNAIMGTVDEAVAYAACTVSTPTDQLTHALVYSDNYHQAFLNGTLLDKGQDFGTPSGFTYVPLELKQGKNEFVVKLINNRGDWFLRILVANPENNLSFSNSRNATDTSTQKRTN